MQKTIENGATVLTADEGMRLTNGETFCAIARLGVHASDSEWWEVTSEEAEQMKADLEEDEELRAEEALAIIVGGESVA